jgi:hypothetical protein
MKVRSEAIEGLYHALREVGRAVRMWCVLYGDKSNPGWLTLHVKLAPAVAESSERDAVQRNRAAAYAIARARRMQ